MKPKEVPDIIVDIHEEQSDLFEDIYARDLGNCTEEYLISGDVSISHKAKLLGTEIKRGPDFENSLHSGRLSNQIVNMAELFDMSFLIVEGWHPFVTDSDDEYTIAEKVRKHELTIRTLNRRLITYETRNQNQTIDLLGEIIKDLTSGKLFQMTRKAVDIDAESPQKAFLGRLPHVGVQTATEILERFKTPAIAFENLESWIDVKGITEERLAEIKKVLYGSD